MVPVLYFTSTSLILSLGETVVLGAYLYEGASLCHLWRFNIFGARAVFSMDACRLSSACAGRVPLMGVYRCSGWPAPGVAGGRGGLGAPPEHTVGVEAARDHSWSPRGAAMVVCGCFWHLGRWWLTWWCLATTPGVREGDGSSCDPPGVWAGGSGGSWRLLHPVQAVSCPLQVCIWGKWRVLPLALHIPRHWHLVSRVASRPPCTPSAVAADAYHSLAVSAQPTPVLSRVSFLKPKILFALSALSGRLPASSRHSVRLNPCADAFLMCLWEKVSFRSFYSTILTTYLFFVLRIALAIRGLCASIRILKLFVLVLWKMPLIDIALNLFIALYYIVYFSPKIFVTVPGTSENALNTGRSADPKTSLG